MNALQPDIDYLTIPATQHQDWHPTMAWVDELQRGVNCSEWTERTTSWMCTGQHGNAA